MSRWFRHYAGMVRDDKLVRASIKSKQSIERVVWIWGAVLESAAEIDDDARYEVEPEEIARFLRCKSAHVQAILDALKDLGRIDDERVSTWSKRQFKSDRSNERVAAHRESKKRSGNGDVTLQGRHRNSPDTETDTETDTESSVAKATGTVVPLVDPEKAMFDHGVTYLAACGIAESKARPLIGKWRKALGGSGAVIEALGAAQRLGVADPASWMEARNRSVAAFKQPAVPL
jgi:hypothetical protein